MGMTKRQRRVGVLINHAALLLLLVVWYGSPFAGLSEALRIAGALVPLIIVGISYYVIHLATGLWALVHARPADLDERQIGITLLAARFSYAVFSVLCLLALFGAAVAGNHGIILFDAILPACMLYLAHTLPSSYLAWVEKEV
ncbi:MAG TPA: hypothetical protein VMX35_04160 [Acidobacteriota bacterium]|nr:hypothetical protein [Acidobacteriota bacterium]